VASQTVTSDAHRKTAPLSVIIPAYNAEAFLAEAILSVQNQTLKVAETIVVADDCADRTPQIAAELGAIVLQQNRRNMAAGLNLGIKASSQRWIALLDADDIWSKEKVALQWRAIEEYPSAALVAADSFSLQYGTTTHLSAATARKRWENIKSTERPDGIYFVEKVPGKFLPRFDLLTSSALLRRDVFSQVGFFDETLIFGQTLELFARVLARYPLAFVEVPLVYHRLHDRNHTRNIEAYWPMYISIIDRMLRDPQLYPERAGEAYRDRLKQQQFHLFERALAQRRREQRTPKT